MAALSIRNLDDQVSAIVLSVFVGAAGSPIWLIPLGAWLGSALGVADPLLGIYTSGNNVIGGMGGILAVLSVLASSRRWASTPTAGCSPS